MDAPSWRQTLRYEQLALNGGDDDEVDIFYSFPHPRAINRREGRLRVLSGGWPSMLHKSCKNLLYPLLLLLFLLLTLCGLILLLYSYYNYSSRGGGGGEDDLELLEEDYYANELKRKGVEVEGGDGNNRATVGELDIPQQQQQQQHEQQDLSPPAAAPVEKGKEKEEVDHEKEKLQLMDEEEEESVMGRRKDEKQEAASVDEPPLSLPYWAKTDIRVGPLFATMPIPNRTEDALGNGLGFNVSYDRQRVLKKEPPLEVIVMPHSHNDPGFQVTFEQYYWGTTNSILSGSVKYLQRMADTSFEWAEICFLEMWWANHGVKEREAFTKLVESGRLEILTGGWVMPDEANSHYFGLVMSLLDGHEWLRNHLLGGAYNQIKSNITPVSHWSIDSFGQSPTFPYLLGKAGIHQGVIARTHYALKNLLAERRQLEFRWRQSWQRSDEGDFLTHLMHGDKHISETCGVEPKICCQFDFEHPGKECLADWGAYVVAVNAGNLVKRADLLADQFWKKAQLYSEANVLFVPWGEDQRYKSQEEWSNQHDNLRRLFDHINAHPADYNMWVRFGTIRDYFEAWRKRHRHQDQQHQTPPSSKSNKGAEAVTVLPTLSGDLLPYARRERDYWCGHYSTRPYHKHLDRSLQHYLRVADLLFTAAETTTQGGEGEKRSGDELQHLYPRLVEARRALSLFQHHDALTGVAYEPVMQDYTVRMFSALDTCAAIINKATAALLPLPLSNPPSGESGGESHADAGLTNTVDANAADGNGDAGGDEQLELDIEFRQNALPQQRILTPPTELVLFNPLGWRREEVVCVLVPMPSSSLVVVYESASSVLPPRRSPRQQIEPVVVLNEEGKLALVGDRQKLCFLANLPALGFRNYYLDYATPSSSTKVPDGGDEKVKLLIKGEVERRADVDFNNADDDGAGQPTSIHMANEHFSLGFQRHSGLLSEISFVKNSRKSGEPQPESSPSPLIVELSFELYEPDPTSGTYVCLPLGPSSSRPPPPSAGDSNPSLLSPASAAFVLIDGPLRKSLVARVDLGPARRPLLHTVELDIGLPSVMNDSSTSGGLFTTIGVSNLIDLSGGGGGGDGGNVDVAMRLRVIKGEEEADENMSDFYTELNAYQYTRRRRRHDLPLEAQFFPMPGAAFIQGSRHRLSLLGKQALAAASLEPGWLEVVLDRRVWKDGRGGKDELIDNRPTLSQFRLALEEFTEALDEKEWGPEEERQADIAYNSIGANHASLQLHYPVVVQYRKSSRSSAALAVEKSLSGNPLPFDTHLVALRTLSGPTNYDPAAIKGDGHQQQLVEFTSLSTAPLPAAALILHRLGVESRLEGLAPLGEEEHNKGRTDELIEVDSLFGGGGSGGMPRPKRVAEASLTLLHVATTAEATTGEGNIGDHGNVSELVIDPMEIKTWLLEYR